MDLGFMYNRAVEDPDGHVFELAFMDMSAATAMGGEAAGMPGDAPT